MSRLDDFILRMRAQRACIDAAAARIQSVPGPILELGLGNGRTYDHLRMRFPGRDIFVFDREVAAHPDCIPPEQFLRLGDFRTSVPAFLAQGWPSAPFIHADIGSANRQASLRLAADLAPTLIQILAPGGYLACDQAIELSGLESLGLPQGNDGAQYHLYRRAS